MGKKYFCWSIDDGLEQDKKIVWILKESGMGATFNLNSGMFGQKDMIGRIGNIGWKITSAERYKKSHHFIKYTKSYRIPKDEVRQVYEGFEVASHGWHHNDFRTASREKTKTSILQDKKNLEKIFGTAISGFAHL